MKPAPTLKERMLHMLRGATTADVTFVVGDEKVRIPAHSQVLAAASDSFKAMFYGDFNREKEVDIPDASPEGFRALLRYIYTDESYVTEDNLESMLRLSDKYLLHGLFADCVKWAKNNVNASNACRFLPVAELFSEISEMCWQIALHHGDDALESDAFLGLPRELIVKMLGSDELTADEKRVFHRTVMWAEQQLKINGEQITSECIRATLGDVLYLIRFPLFDATEFSDGPAESGILSDKECVSLFQWFTAQKKPSLFRVDARCGIGLGKIVELFGMRLHFDCHHSRQVKTDVGTLRGALETARLSCRKHGSGDYFWACLTCYEGFCAAVERCGPYGHSEDTSHGLYLMKKQNFCYLFCSSCRQTIASL